MLNPVIAQTIEFTSDGTSTALVVDLALAPASINLRGSGPLTIILPTVNSILGVGPTVTATIVGTVATFTFAAALQQLNAGTTVLYSLAFYVQF